MMKSTNLLFINSVLCLSLLILPSCTNSSIPTNEFITPSTTLTPSITPSPSLTPTPSITPAVIIKPAVHNLAVNEGNIREIRNLATFGTPSEYCQISDNLDSAVETRLISDQTEYLLASTDRENHNIQVWNLETEKSLKTFNSDNVDSVLFAPDQRTLLSFFRYEPGTLTLWGIESGKQLQKFLLKPNYYYDERTSISPDGLRIALFSVPRYTENFRISEFNLQTNEMSDSDYAFPLYRESPPPHIYSSSGNLIAITYNKDDKLHLLDLTNHKDTILQFPFSNLDEVGLADAFVETISMSSNEKYVAGGTLSGNIYVWKVADGSILESFEAHEPSISDGWSGGVKILEFSPESNLLLSVGYNDSTKLWDAKSGVLLKEINTCHHFGGFTQDGHYLVTVGKNGIELWGIPE